MKPIRCVLIDDHHVLREAVAAMLAAESDIVVIGQAGDAPGGCALVRETHPDIVITDLKMPGQSGLGAIGEIAKEFPGIGIIVFTMYDNAAYVWETMNAGARGYVLKSASKTDLLREMQVLEFLAEGKSNKLIARTLSITEETVKTHLRNLYEKLGAADRAHAVAIALRQRLIE